jgi:hypothetical protein
MHPRGSFVAAERSHPISGVMQHLELSDEEAAALIKELADLTGKRSLPVLIAYPDREGDPSQAATGTGPRTRAASEGVFATTVRGRQKATAVAKAVNR